MGIGMQECKVSVGSPAMDGRSIFRPDTGRSFVSTHLEHWRCGLYEPASCVAGAAHLPDVSACRFRLHFFELKYVSHGPLTLSSLARCSTRRRSAPGHAAQRRRLGTAGPERAETHLSRVRSGHGTALTAVCPPPMPCPPRPRPRRCRYADGPGASKRLKGCTRN